MITLNSETVHTTLFPDQTSQVWKVDLPKDGIADVVWDYLHEGEFMQLAQLKALLDKENIPAILTLNYLPYGRQDKETGNLETFALRPFAKLLNSLNFDMVRIIDPHSDTALKLINKSVDVYPIVKLLKAEVETKSNIVCYPDKGARNKYGDKYDFRNTIYADKIREQSTGKILSLELHGNPKGKRVMIVDDICDGGVTFVALSKQLYAAGAEYVTLFVTHGIFSKGLSPLHEAGIIRVFTKDGEAFEFETGIGYKPL